MIAYHDLMRWVSVVLFMCGGMQVAGSGGSRNHMPVVPGKHQSGESSQRTELSELDAVLFMAVSVGGLLVISKGLTSYF